MKRMDRNHEVVRRLIFTVWIAFSLLLLLVTAAMWVRSYYWWDSAAWPTGTSTALSVSSQFGGIDILESYYVANRYFGFRPERPTKFQMNSFRCDPYRPYWRLDTANAVLGFYYDHLPTLYRRLLIPYWAITLVLAVCPVAWLLTRRRRRIVGCCPTCNYDLRATPGQCPECGTPVRSPTVVFRVKRSASSHA